jgi:6-phosphofructokinase 2
LGEYFGAVIDSEQSELEAASALIAEGAAEHVALTLGAGGALLVSASGAVRSPAPPVDVVSTVGAGDSFLAAFVLRLAQERSLEDAFRAAVAAGTAAVMRPATELCHRADVEELEARITESFTPFVPEQPKAVEG